MAEARTGGSGASRLFTDFMERLGLGLQVRVEGECRVVPPEAEPVAQGSIGGKLPDGALVARTAWTLDGQEGSGCFLWVGDFGALLGGGDKPASALSCAEVDTLAQSLRINVQEGGDDDLVLQWTDPEQVAAGELAASLREAGIAAETRGERHVLQLGEERLTFLFLEAPSGTPAAEPAAAPEAAAEGAAPEPAPEPEPAAPVAAEPEPTPAAKPASTPAPAPEGVVADASFLGGILELPLSLQVRLGTTHMSLDELLHLIPGSVIELEQREEEPLEVLANGRVVARGEVVVVDERFGVRITEIVTSRERLAAV